MRHPRANRTGSVAIIGGGIGGLAAALSLLRAGVDVHVYEQAEELAEVGAGVQLSPNASRVLHGLGLAEALGRTAVRPQAWHQRRWDDGRTLLRTPLGDAAVAAFGFPYYHVHRADLLAVLAAAVPAARIHLGYRLTGLEEHGDHVEARFESGARVRADVLVGADGIHSDVRRIVFGPERPRFTGSVAYRGLVPAERLRALGLEVSSELWMGPGRHFVHYFVSGGRLVNFVGVVERDTWTRESWTDRARVADALADFEGWHPLVREILAAAEEPNIWALFDRAPMQRWSTGRVTLLGDACHPMLPFIAQGAAQSIEDGAALAASLAGPGTSVAAALRRYEARRIARTAHIQAASARSKASFHLPDGAQQRRRDAQMSAGAIAFAFDAVSWVYGHDATVTEEAA
jgi:salicylate hydroxylase